MNARLKPLEFGWDNASRLASEERGPASRPKTSARASEPAARVPAMQPGMTLDEWLTKIAEKKTKRPEVKKPSRTATLKEFEAALARVHGKGAEEASKTEESTREPAAPRMAVRTADAVARLEPAISEAAPEEAAEPDQVAKIAKAMSMIADWMDHVDERSVDTSRLVLQQQERTTRVLVSAVTSVSKRLTEMAQQIKVLEDRIAALTAPAPAE